jgi:hypothetical protein
LQVLLPQKLLKNKRTYFYAWLITINERQISACDIKAKNTFKKQKKTRKVRSVSRSPPAFVCQGQALRVFQKVKIENLPHPSFCKNLDRHLYRPIPQLSFFSFSFVLLMSAGKIQW